jgi:hypothetical protein
MTVTENGITYKANWWTQGTDPADDNGAFGAPWTAIAGAISQGPTLWSAGNVYTAGMTTIEDGIIYQANWWCGLRSFPRNSMKSEEFWLCASPSSPPGSTREARQARPAFSTRALRRRAWGFAVAGRAYCPGQLLANAAIASSRCLIACAGVRS